MREWQEPALAGSPRRDAILLAVADHDNGWAETDAAPVLDSTGHILDFVAIPAARRQEVWPRGVARLGAVPYAAALVAQHAIHVYSRFRGDAAWTAFFGGMEREPQEDGFGRTVRFDGERVMVHPDPFAGRALDIQVTGRELGDTAFDSQEAARAAIDAAPLRTITATVTGI